MPGNSTKFDQLKPEFCRILLGQTSVIGGGGRYDRAAYRDTRHAERWRVRQRETAFAARTLRQSTQ